MASPEKVPRANNIIQSEHYGYEKDFRTAFPQIIAVSVKNLLLLGYGMTLGFTTILIPAVKDPNDGEILHLRNSEISWISSINLIVVPLGCALSGVVTTPIGRRKAMQLVNLPFLVAWLLFHFAKTTGDLYGALCLTGLAGGLLEAPVLTYVAEITQPHLRGALSATSSMCIIIGVFTQFLFGLFMYWRTVALLNISFTILSVVSLYFIPESPHWLVSRRRLDEAKKSLYWLRGWKKSSAIDRELADIVRLYDKNTNAKVKVHKTDEDDKTLWSKVSCYMEKSFLLPFFLVSYAFFVGHFSGMTTLQMLEAPIDKYYATLILGVLQILGSALCVLLVHYTGKRPLTLFSTAGAAICCVLVASYDGSIRTYSIPEVAPSVNETTFNMTSSDTIMARNPYSWMPTVLLMLLALITHTGIRLLPWILIGEVFSSRTRSGGAGLAGAVGYIFGFLTNKMYISMVDTMHIVGTYGLYSVVSTGTYDEMGRNLEILETDIGFSTELGTHVHINTFVGGAENHTIRYVELGYQFSHLCFGATGCVVFYFILPETEGKKLNDIENHFAGIKKLTNQVYRSKRKQALEMDKMGTVNLSFECDSSRL